MGKLFSLQTLVIGMGNNSITGQPNQHIKKLLTFDLNGVTSTNIQLNNCHVNILFFLKWLGKSSSYKM